MTSSGETRRAALVTGGALRIGRAIVEALADAGYAVAIHARGSLGAARDLAHGITGQGGRAEVVAADLADHAGVARLVADATAAIGPLTLLVNNACEFTHDAVGTLAREPFDRMFAVNLRAPVFLAQAFAAQAPADANASIVNMLDQRVFRLTPSFFSYTLTKSALHAATTMLAQAMAPQVRVNAVAPGPTLPSARQSAADFARQSASVPLGQGPSPQEVADAVLFLARSISITGETITLDGGQHLDWRAGADVTE